MMVPLGVCGGSLQQFLYNKVKFSSLCSLRLLSVCGKQFPIVRRHQSGDVSEPPPPQKSKLYDRILGPSSCIAKPGLNRWSMFVPAFTTHICLGAPYGWSAISASMTKEYGFVTSAAADWSIDVCTYPMSIMIAVGGISAALLGTKTIKMGTRASIFTGGVLWSTALAISATGVAIHNLPLLYAGNFLAGVGYGFAYTPPIQALLEWFPDKRGLASGVVIAGFGSGALFFTPMMNLFLQKFSSLPQYLGQSVETVTEGGRMFARTGDNNLTEVVYATAQDIAKLPFPDLVEGFYVVGSGNTGVACGLAAMSLIYGAAILSSAMLIKKPHTGYVPQGYVPTVGTSSLGNVNVNSVMKTPQFWLLFTTSTLLATGGMGLMSVAKPMISDVFSSSMPHLVTATFASSYLMAMAAGNLGGRLLWAAISDKIGRKATFNIFTMGAVPVFASLPYCINQVVLNPDGAAVYLGLFCASTVTAISVMGGVFSVLPAYEADLYGPKYVQAIHGRFLVAATLSTVLGPSLLLNLRKISENSALQDLLAKVDPAKFQETFGVNLSQAETLIEAKTLTISKLMTIMPPGTIDPSPFIYNNTMYTMAGLVGLGATLHFMVRPVDPKYFEK